MHDFTPIPALIGGVLIGVAAVFLLLAIGRIAGVAGVFGGLLAGKRDSGWRASFLAGLLLAGIAAAVWVPGKLGVSPHSLPTLAVAGLLVGFGTQLGNGCTSGHGVCGIGRFSPRSIAATLTFMVVAIATVALWRLAGGAA